MKTVCVLEQEDARLLRILLNDTKITLEQTKYNYDVGCAIRKVEQAIDILKEK